MTKNYSFFFVREGRGKKKRGKSANLWCLNSFFFSFNTVRLFPLMVASARSRTVPQGDRCKFAQKPEAIWSIKNIPGDISTGKSKKVGWVCKCWGSWQHQEPRESFAKDSIHHRCPWISPLKKKRHIHTTTPHQLLPFKIAFILTRLLNITHSIHPFPPRNYFFFSWYFLKGYPYLLVLCACTADSWPMEASFDNGKTFSGTVNKKLIFDGSFFLSEFSFSRLLNYFFFAVVSFWLIWPWISIAL